MMSSFQRKATRCGIVFTMAASLLISNLPLAFAGPGDTNSVNTGQDVAGGTYYNTSGNQTVFQNPGGDLIVGAGTTVVGREVNSGGALTGNGGSMLFNAPGNMVRVDGTIDVSGILKGDGSLGNGGLVQINSAYLYQNGNIFANGGNAGSVQINVGSMTMGPNAQIQAASLNGGNGGIVDIKATGAVNIGTNAIIDTSGKVIGTYNTNVISIEGGLVNLNGIINANGLVAGDQGGAVSLVALNGDVNIGGTGAVTANGADGGNGGVAGVGAAKGSVNNSGVISANGGDGYYSNDPSLGNAGDAGIVLVAAKNNITNNGAITANGGNGFVGWNPTSGGQGGAVVVDAGNRLDNNGQITANGGHGGTNADTAVGPVIFNPDNGLQQTSLGQDGGHGGDAGTVTLAFKNDSITNSGIISANGGNGGNGQEAVSNDPGAKHHYAIGGNGGNGGNGGFIEFYGKPSQTVLDNTQVAGGHGGQGGPATPKDCSCGGSAGGCGSPGQIAIHPPKDIPKIPPPPPPVFPPPYPKENPRLGDNLPPGVGSVLSYNRSIFLARAPLPIVQKRKPVPVEITPPPPPPQPKPAPVPPKRRVPVRGYW